MRQPTASATPDFGAPDFFGTGKTGLTSGVPSVTPASVATAEQANAQLGELRSQVEISGTALNPLDYAQIAQVAIGRREIDALLAAPLLADIDSAGAHIWRAAACNNLGRVVVVGSAGKIRTMDDFSGTWTSRTASGSYSGTFNDIVWTGVNFVAVGTAGEAQTSPDGTTWTHRSTGVGDIARVACTGSTLIAVATAIATIKSTDSGLTWATVSSITSTCGFIAVNAGVWIASEGGAGVREVWRSTDGVTFSAVSLTSLLSTNEKILDVVARAPGLGFAAMVLDTSDSTTKLLGSPDGLTWTVVADISSTTTRTLCAGRAGVLLTPSADTAAIPAYFSYDAHSGGPLYPRPHGGTLGRVQFLQMNNTGFWVLLGASSQAGYAAVSASLAP